MVDLALLAIGLFAAFRIYAAYKIFPPGAFSKILQWLLFMIVAVLCYQAINTAGEIVFGSSSDVVYYASRIYLVGVVVVAIKTAGLLKDYAKRYPYKT